MFAFQARRVLRLCDKLLVRELRNRKLPGPNPGLDGRIAAFKKDGVQIDEDNAEEYIEGSEGSFYNVNEVYNEHLNETLIGKHEHRHHIVKAKYFKENMPNLLTWSEKEQIRHLFTTMPQEWTPQRIAESFPITEATAKKLLKYPWKPGTDHRIARHDASAMRNWRELKEGMLDIPEDLREHFLKFSDRTIPPLNKSSVRLDLTEEKIGEYESIIKRCASSQHVEENTNDEINTDIHVNTDKNKKDYSKLTLDQLANKIRKRIEKGHEVNVPDKMIIDSISLQPEQNVDKSQDIQIHNQSNEQNNLTEHKEDPKSLQPAFLGMNYPERIRVPKNAYKKNATYKVNDCFYDHDGRFLYRVIGISGNSN